MRRADSTKRVMVITMAIVFATATLGTSSCDEKKVRKELWKWKNKTGKALVATNKAWDKWYQAEADRIGDEIIADNPGLSDDEYLALFEKALAPLDEHDKRFKKAMKGASHSNDAFEETLDAWNHATMDRSTACKAIETGRDLTSALSDLIQIVQVAGAPYEGPLNTIDTIIAGLGKLLDLIECEPDPDSE